jgi:hypothetical protein
MSTLKVDTIASDTTPTVTISDGLSVSGVTTSTGAKVTGQLEVTTGANSFLTSANVFKGTAGQKGVYLRSALSSATTPTYSSVDDTNTGIFLPGSDVFGVTTAGTERLRISSGGAVGINTTASSYPFQVQTDGTSTTVGGNIVARFQSSGAAGRDATIQLSDNVSHSATISMLSSNLAFANAGTESVRIDSAGRLLIGSTASNQVWGLQGALQVEGTTASTATAALISNQNSNAPFYLAFCKSRGTSDGSATVVQDGDYLGTISFTGADGTDRENTSGRIDCVVDGTPGGNDTPGRLMFSTTADGAGGVSERLRITSAGAWGIAGANYGTSGQVLTSQGSGSAVQWASVSGGPTHYSKFTLESVQGNQNPINNWDLYSPGISPTINTAVTNTNGVFSFPSTGIWECQASILFYLNGGTTEFRLETYGTTDDGSSWDIIGRQYGWFHNNSSTNYMSVSTMPFLLDITNTSNCKVKFVIAGGPGTLYTGGDDNDLYSGCHFIRWADT